MKEPKPSAVLNVPIWNCITINVYWTPYTFSFEYSQPLYTFFNYIISFHGSWKGNGKQNKVKRTFDLYSIHKHGLNKINERIQLSIKEKCFIRIHWYSHHTICHFLRQSKSHCHISSKHREVATATYQWMNIHPRLIFN